MFNYPKSPLRVRRMPMHLSSGHVTLMPGKFSPLISLQSDIGRRAGSRCALLQIFSFFLTRDLRDSWADRRKILHDGQH